MQSSKRVLRVVCLVAVAVTLSALAASAASASPAWEFNGTVLVGSEAVVGGAISSGFTVPSAPTTCAHMQLRMTIVNVAGVGKGEVTEFPMSGCTAPNCTVNSIEAEDLPWPVHAVTVAGKDYVVIEKIHIGILYGGLLCGLAGSPVTIKGTAGGLYENTTVALTFNKTSFSATGTALKVVGGGAVEWNGIFPVEALGAHSGEALGLS